MHTIDTARFVVIDTETSGIDPEVDTVIEVAAIDAGGAIEPPSVVLDTLVAPGRPISADISGITGLIDADFADAPSRAHVADMLCATIDTDAVLVAHNAAFDRAMLPELSTRRWLCTQRLAMHLVPGAPNYKLATLRYLLLGEAARRINTFGRDAHRAIADVAVTVAVLHELIHLWGQHPQFESGSVDELIAFSERPVEMAALPFGKHRGQPMSAVPLDYLRWMLRNHEFTGDVRYTVSREVARRTDTAAA